MKQQQLKKIFCICITAIVFCLAYSETLYANQVSVYVNNSYVVSDQPPIIENGRTLIPLRAVGESLDCQVEWNSLIKKVSLMKSDMLIVLYIGNQNTYVYNSGQETVHYLDTPPCIVNSRTMVPLRFVSEILGYNVEWDGNTKTVYISGNNTNKNNYKTDYDVSYDSSSAVTENSTLNNSIDTEIDDDFNHLSDLYDKQNTSNGNGSDVFEQEDYNNYNDYEDYGTEDQNTYYEDDNYGYEDEQPENDYYSLTNEELAYMGYEALNSYRVENGVPELEYNADLFEAAQRHAEDMAENGYFDHTSPDGRSPYDRAHEVTDEFSYIGENIAFGGGTPHDIVYFSFAGSEGHNENMLDENYTAVGIGYCDGHWVQLFGG